MILTLHNDNRPLTCTRSGADLGVADMTAALQAVREAWSDHRVIAMLPAWSVVAGDGVDDHRRSVVEDGMANAIFDLGNSAEDAWIGARNAIANSVSAATEPKQDAIAGMAHGCPVICVASGPSAHDHMRDIAAAHAAGAVVVCADSIYQALVSHGIEPDFVCVLERQAVFAAMVPPGITSRTRLVCPPVVDPSTAIPWSSRRVWFWQTVPGLYEWLGPNVPRSYSGRSAGTLAVAVSLLLGGTSIYLVGHDLCRIGGNSHAVGVGSFTTEGQSRAEASACPGDIHEPCDMRCRDGEMRKSTRFWTLCASDIAAMCSRNGSVFAVDMRGAIIANTCAIPRMHITRAPGIRASLGDVTPSRYCKHLSRQIVDDVVSFHRSTTGTAHTAEDAVGLMKRMCPAHWAHADTRRLHEHVLGPVYNAASLRAHIRRNDPLWWQLQIGVLRRGIPPILSMMEHDLC